MSPDPNPSQKTEPRLPNERRRDAVTLILAVVLTGLVVAAIGYGIFNSRQVTAAIPSVPSTHRIQ